MTEQDFVETIRAHGGRVFLVGGWVRDKIRGEKASDKDYVLTGLSEALFCALFPKAERVGKAFPVYLVPIDGERREVAFARKEHKTGAGYRGFAVSFSPSVTIEEDLYRRDTTMNSLALKLPLGRLLDPYGGRADIEAGRVRAVSAHFTEDPVRSLRAARQAACFGYEITPETLAYMHATRAELREEPPERVLTELRRALAAPRPSLFFRWLLRAGLLDVTFPEIFALIGKTQPAAFHPEGDAYEHTLLALDRAASFTESETVRFAALAHDLGKGTTPEEMLPHHYGHEQRGLAVLAAWNARMTLPRPLYEAAAFAIREHMRAPRLKKPKKILALLLAIEKSPFTCETFGLVLRADFPGRLPWYLAHGEAITRALHTVSGREAPAGLRGRAVGDWLMGARTRLLCQWQREHTSG